MSWCPDFEFRGAQKVSYVDKLVVTYRADGSRARRFASLAQRYGADPREAWELAHRTHLTRLGPASPLGPATGQQLNDVVLVVHWHLLAATEAVSPA